MKLSFSAPSTELRHLKICEQWIKWWMSRRELHFISESHHPISSDTSFSFEFCSFSSKKSSLWFWWVKFLKKSDFDEWSFWNLKKILQLNSDFRWNLMNKYSLGLIHYWGTLNRGFLAHPSKLIPSFTLTMMVLLHGIPHTPSSRFYALGWGVPLHTLNACHSRFFGKLWKHSIKPPEWCNWFASPKSLLCRFP